jgi:adenine-specific DNA-methyltransferase
MVEKVNLSVNKKHGRIYTPDYIVFNIFDLAGYRGKGILEKHVIDNSCGDGAFLKLIVKEYCQTFLQFSKDLNQLRTQLEKYIHGIELDEIEVKSCIDNMKKVASEFGVEKYEPDVMCSDSLEVSKYDGKMHFVLGNPPYVRVHNLGDSYDKIKKHNFSEGGMTDLYIIFYEIGLKMLSQDGVLTYIAPSSWFTSVAGKKMREYFENNSSIRSLCNLKHFQPFNATTYTCILTLTKKGNDSIVYYLYDSKRHEPLFLTELQYKDVNIEGNFYFSTREDLHCLKKIINNFYLGDEVEVKNGFATLADDIFISEKFSFKSKYILSIFKSSTAQWKECIFPYENGKLISTETLLMEEELYLYLQRYERDLKKRSLDKGTLWYGFGRSQGIKDVSRERIALNSLVRDLRDIKTEILKPGTGVYSGLYILSSHHTKKIIGYIKSKEFVNYISLLGKYKSGGYYTFSSKDVKNYLVYKIMEEKNNG